MKHLLTTPQSHRHPTATCEAVGQADGHSDEKMFTELYF